MTTFDKREAAFEQKFALDAELRFKANARRNGLLGHWAAGLMGKTGAEAEAYAKEIVVAGIGEAGKDEVYRKVKQDLEKAGVGRTEHQIRRTMEELMAEAVNQIENDTK